MRSFRRMTQLPAKETPHLDPGEPAAPFALTSWTFDHDTREFVTGAFDLGGHAGRIVYFHIFGLG